MGVNAAGNIYRYTGDHESGHWKQINGGLKGIDAGSRTNVWGVNAADSVYSYTNNDANPWIQIPGGLSDIGAAADGTVWGSTRPATSTATPATSPPDRPAGGPHP
ncbi:tectonin domain-containing protein [Streptomyces zhihengii]